MPRVVRELGSHCIAAAFIGESACFALADGVVHRWGKGEAAIPVHGGLLAAVPTADRTGLFTSGEDGRVCRLGAAGEPVELASVPRRWVSVLASGRDGAFAFAAGRKVWLIKPSGERRELQHDGVVEGLAFSTGDDRLAVAGASSFALHPPATGEPLRLEWPGFHMGVTFSPDGRFVLGPLREGGFHGWRLDAPARHLRMLGYPGKVASWSWTPDGRWLATAGASAVVLWPFDGVNGPIDRTPRELDGAYEPPVTAVACHPEAPVLASGRVDGAVRVVRIDDGEVVELRGPGGGEVSALGWDRAGRRLAFGTAAGTCGILDFRPGAAV